MRMTLLIAVAAVIAGPAGAAPAVERLRCEYRVDPQGIDVLRPRLGWIVTSTSGRRSARTTSGQRSARTGRRGERQTAYQVLVASSPERLAAGRGDLWDSGKVASGQSIQVEYAGRPLASRMRCHWKVRVWDRDGKPSGWSRPAFWSMGLLRPADWRARWIGLRQAPAARAPAAALVVRRAVFQALDGSGERDVTAVLSDLARRQGGLSLEARNEALGGDPAPGHRKRLRVEYELAGKRGEKVVEETERLRIPDDFAEPGEQPVIPRMLRKAFSVDRSVRRATLYATALGLYEVRLNGRRVGDHLLAPEWTNYHKRVQYQTYDVTALLRRGRNALGALVGCGWYCGDWQFWQRRLKPIYGDQPYLLLQLEIERADGSRQVVVSDGSWRGTTDGPLRFSGLYEGETYDARREMPGWDSPGFDDRAWQPAVVATAKAGRLVWQRSEPIRATQELRPVAVTQPKPGVWVFDLGQNIAGWCRLKLRQPGGTTVTLKLNEVLNPDGTVYMDNLHAGHLSTGDRQIIRYTCRGGGEETYEPRFSTQGFRYVEVTGLTSRPAASMLTGRVLHTAFRPAGSFTCSNPLLNRLALNIQWSQRANMMGVPTDCCQRDERCGYTGDGQFFMPTAVYNFDTAAFYNKWLVDVCQDSQRPDGTFGDHAPDYGMGGDNVGWSDAGIICPYVIYRTYGDTRILRDHYAAMKRCLEMLVATSHGFTRGPEHVGNGDWLNLGGGASPEVIGTAYYAYDFRMMAEIAAVLGETKDAAAFRERADNIAAAFARAFVDGEGRIRDSSQTGYALAFTMGLVPPALRQKMAGRFAAEVERFGGHLATGFIGTPRLLPGLHAAGRDDVAYRLLLQESFPSWLFQVKNGATTMWERWDGWMPGKGFQDSGMNSFNHYAFGSVGEYLFGVVGGIQAEKPGYAKIRIAPAVGEGLTWAKTSYDSIRGRIATAWRRDGNALSLDVTIPANTTAVVHVPAGDAGDVTESGRPAGQSEGVRFLRRETGAAVFRVGSGEYRFSSRQ